MNLLPERAPTHLLPACRPPLLTPAGLLNGVHVVATDACLFAETFAVDYVNRRTQGSQWGETVSAWLAGWLGGWVAGWLGGRQQVGWLAGFAVLAICVASWW
jgi:hypothetical protein